MSLYIIFLWIRNKRVRKVLEQRMKTLIESLITTNQNDNSIILLFQ
jgi:hypothetical protein